MSEILEKWWAVISPSNTPRHLKSVKLFETEQEARDFVAKSEWQHCEVQVAINMSKVMRQEKARAAPVPRETYADVAFDQHCRWLRGLPPRKPRKDRKDA